MGGFPQKKKFFSLKFFLGMEVFFYEKLEIFFRGGGVGFFKIVPSKRKKKQTFFWEKIKKPGKYDLTFFLKRKKKSLGGILGGFR